MTKPDFIWVILAAGGSTRLGQPKQLLSLGGEALIEHQIRTFQATGLPVCVVTGAVDLSPFIDQQTLHTINNPDWEKGMGSSVKLAQQYYADSHIGWVLVDQYAITTEQALDFYHTWQQAPCLALVSRYNDQDSAWGVPVITHKDLMAKANLPERGLKPWLLANHHQIERQYYNWPAALADLDTPAQWQQVQHQERWHDHA